MGGPYGHLYPYLAFHTADLASLTKGLRAYLAMLVGLVAEEEVEVIAHRGSHMADNVALVVRSTHGASSFLYPIVDDKLRLAKKMTN